mgnify:CR=1 FL=1
MTGKLIADFFIPSKLNIDKAVVNFEMRNPETAVECDEDTTYSISIYDYRYNKIIAKTLEKDTECPEFTEKLYDIDISGKTIIEGGNV